MLFLVSSDSLVKYSTVNTFLMKKHTSVSPYLTIETSGNQTISLSENHLINTRIISADKFKPRQIFNIFNYLLFCFCC